MMDKGGKRVDNDEGGKSFSLGELDVPADALYSRIVEEVGDRQYLARWANNVAAHLRQGSQLPSRMETTVPRKELPPQGYQTHQRSGL